MYTDVGWKFINVINFMSIKVFPKVCEILCITWPLIVTVPWKSEYNLLIMMGLFQS